MIKAQTLKGTKKKIAIFIDAANFDVEITFDADVFIDLRDCDFVVKKAP